MATVAAVLTGRLLQLQVVQRRTDGNDQRAPRASARGPHGTRSTVSRERPITCRPLPPVQTPTEVGASRSATCSEARRVVLGPRRGVYLRLRFDAPTIRTLPPLGLNVLTWPSAQRTS